ncbi:hypothetical protein FOQG_18732 [Fusarium oxysporum f. sp. raphani 54005]|uniref:Uncharacterized protein n=2 Tax=Fusarium oxysporum TaxID=5507 RepID=X0BDF0_FUSOX|nr:hypothetical protein FOQG_18732 [Fusarium oxysporum f. sp. raphani 54005]EXM12965.1 hypothetical protein FOTG_18564 [Fusarium oxysporum f. sp. vasinfectum 25433]
MHPPLDRSYRTLRGSASWCKIRSVLVKSLERYNDLVDNIRPNLFHLSQDRPTAITE